MPEITLNLTAEEANGVLLALSKFSIEQAGSLYSKVQYQLAVQLQAAKPSIEMPPASPAAPPAHTDTEGGSTE